MTIVRVTPDGLIYAVDLVMAIKGCNINQSHKYLANRKFSKSKFKKHANRKLLTLKAAIKLILACTKNIINIPQTWPCLLELCTC